jgi:hypothetical protein
MNLYAWCTPPNPLLLFVPGIVIKRVVCDSKNKEIQVWRTLYILCPNTKPDMWAQEKTKQQRSDLLAFIG